MSSLWDNIVEGIADFMYSPTEENLYECFNAEELNSITGLLSLNATQYSNAWAVINSTLTVIKPVGFALITTFFLIYIFDLASKDQMTFDMLVKIGVQLIVVIAIAANLDTIVNKLLEIGQGIFKDIGSDTSSYDKNVTEDIQKKVQTWKDMYIEGTGLNNWDNYTSPLGGIIKSTLLKLCFLIAEIACSFAAISRMLDIAWRIAFAPIGIANSYEGGANSGGVRYLKALLASILAGAVMLVIFKIGFAIAPRMLTVEGGSSFWGFFLSAAAIFATAGASFSASQKAKEIVT